VNEDFGERLNMDSLYY